MGAPGRSASSTEEAAAAALRNDAAPPVGPQAETPDDPEPRGERRKNMRVQNVSVINA